MKRLTRSMAAVLIAVGLVGSTGMSSAIAVASAGARHTAAAKLSAPLLGVDVYSESDYSLSATTQYGSLVLPYARDDLKAQEVSLMWDLCTPSSRSNTVRACKSDAKTGTGSMSSADISDLANVAKTDGLSVQMRPIIRVGPPSGWNSPHLSWEGHIKPSNLEAWFKSVLNAELPYLKVARSVGVEQFVVGTEWLNVRYSKWWPWFLGKAHADCGCQVSYAAPTSMYLNNSASLPHVKALGTDFYPALNLPASASQAKVTAAWEKALGRVPESRLDRTSLDEISIRATAGAYRHPSSWNDGGRSDPTVQVRYFTAACKAAARYHLRALFFYFIPLNDNPAHPVSFPAYFVDNAGSKAIAGCSKIL
jgi:hypothetical protein